MKNTVLRYTVMRLMIFFGSLILFWLLGLRSQDQQPMLLVLSALTSLVVSYFFLRRDRDAMSSRLAGKMHERAERRRGVVGEDEEAEDSELEDR
ncbi:MAG: DUF4229 domain-containing protein [Actinomycetota bacterium]|nr:DUF4229 domain-containing protein [Actinomycetota bacterium]